MEQVDPKKLNYGNLIEAIKITKKQMAKFKGQDVRCKKYETLLKKLEPTKKQIETIFEETKKIEMDDGKSFYDQFISGKESAMTLEYLGRKLEECKKEGKIAKGKLEIKIAPEEEVDIHYDMVDRTKQFGKDLLEGKGKAKGILYATLGVGLGEALSLGVTNMLTSQGIMSGATGLFGLAKMALPAGWSAISSAVVGLTGFSTIVAGAVAGVIALKAVPAVKHLIDKAKEKSKNSRALEDGLGKMISGQKELA